MIESLRTLADLGRSLGRLLGGVGSRPFTDSDPRTAELMTRADEAQRDSRREEAATLYRQVLQRQRGHLGALRGMRELAVSAGQWSEALEIQQRLLGLASPSERNREAEWLAVMYYESGRRELGRGDAAAAIAHFKNALRADRAFVPAALALGDAFQMAGDPREAVKTWERAAEATPALPILARLERAYRQDGRPSRMIALYRGAVERAPDDLAIAVALGRVYFELEMLDEAADQLEKVEVRAPDLPVVHAFLGAVFERRGDMRDACEEYRRALRLSHAFDWPHRCEACGAATSAWQDRCGQCHRWNTLRPAR